MERPWEAERVPPPGWDEVESALYAAGYDVAYAVVAVVAWTSHRGHAGWGPGVSACGYCPTVRDALTAARRGPLPEAG